HADRDRPSPRGLPIHLSGCTCPIWRMLRSFRHSGATRKTASSTRLPLPLRSRTFMPWICNDTPMTHRSIGCGSSDTLSAYHAVYVALAEALDSKVLTCDGRLERAPGVARCVSWSNP